MRRSAVTLSTCSILNDRAEALRLLAHQIHQLRPQNPLGEAGIVLDVGRNGELSARLQAFENERRRGWRGRDRSPPCIRPDRSR